MFLPSTKLTYLLFVKHVKRKTNEIKLSWFVSPLFQPRPTQKPGGDKFLIHRVIGEIFRLRIAANEPTAIREELDTAPMTTITLFTF